MSIFKRGGNRILTAYGVSVESGLRVALRSIYRGLREKRNYQKWIKKYGTVNEKQGEDYLVKIEAFDKKPLISVLLPVYETDEKWLRLCIESVFGQLYANWELCIADDCSSKPHVRRILEEYASKDKRVKLVFRETNGHISAASNSALELVSGEFTVFLDHDDELAEDALFHLAKELNEFPEIALVYSDEDLIDENGRRFSPKFKPDWSRDLFYSVNLVTHLSAFRTSLLREIGGFRLGFEGSQDYDLTLRVIEQIHESQIRHIPRILYHWRAIRGSVAYGGGEKPYAHERAREAIRSHFERLGTKASVHETVQNLHHVRYELPQNLPKVCIFILVDNVQSAVGAATSIGAITIYENYEITAVVQIDDADLKNLSVPINERIKYFVSDSTSEAANLNFAVSQTESELLCFVDANLTPVSGDWLTEIVRFAYQKEIGAVGAKLLYKDKTVLHGGLIIGAGGPAGIAHHAFSAQLSGNLSRNLLVGNFSAVSVSCMAVRRKVFDEVGGFDAVNLPNRFFDVDFCLRLREINYRIVFNPNAELIKIDEKKRANLEKIPTAKEQNYFLKKWSDFIENDPFYNPNLSKIDASFSINI